MRPSQHPKRLSGLGVLRQAAVAACNTPILFRKCARKLPDQNGERLSRQDIFYLHHQVDVVGHYHVGRYRLNAAPFEMETFDDFFKGSRYGAFDKAAIVADLREIGETVKSLERHHVEERRLVVEIEEASHIAYFTILSLEWALAFSPQTGG